MRRSSVLWLAFAVVMACVPGPKAPDVTPTRTLDLAAEGTDKASERPFGVVAASPRRGTSAAGPSGIQGETHESGEVSVVLNRPLRALELEGQESPVPAQIHTREGKPVAGHWQWMGTQAFVFVPDGADGRLPFATVLQVTVPAGTRALDGSSLPAAYSYSFETERPSVRLIGNHQGLEPRAVLRLAANQPVAGAELERVTQIVPAKKGQPTLRVRAKALAEGAPNTVFELTPSSPLPLDSSFTLTIAAGLRGLEGPLPSVAEVSEPLSTYAPLRVSSINCRHDDEGPCDANGGVYVELNNRVSAKALRDAVSVTGRVGKLGHSQDDDGDMTSSYWLPGPFVPGGTLSVQVRAGLRDEFGQVLGSSSSKTLRVADLPPSLEFGAVGSVFERDTPPNTRRVPLRSVNLSSYELGVGELSEEDVARWLGARGAIAEQVLVRDRLTMKTVRPSAAANRSALHTVQLDDVLGKKAGVVAVSARFPGETREHDRLGVYRVSNLAVSAKVSRYGGVIWISRLSDSAPVPGAVVKLRSTHDGGERFSATTDATGLVSVPEGLLFQGERADMMITARAGDDWTYRDLNVNSNVGVWPEPAGKLTSIGMIFTDRGMYRRGEKVHVKALFRDEELRGLVTPVGRTITLEAKDADGTKVFEQSRKLGEFGEASFEVPVAESAPLGSLQFAARVGEDEGRAYETVEIAAYRPAEFKVDTAFGKPAYVRGDQASCSARAEYLFGAPIRQGSARMTWSRRSTSFAPQGHEDRVFDDGTFYDASDARAPNYSILGAGRGEDPSLEHALDDQGEVERQQRLVMPEQHGPELITCEADVTDLSRQSVASESAVVVHPATFYVGLDSPKEWFVAERASLAPQVRTVDPDGRARSGVRVHLDLIERSWTSAYEELGEGGGHYASRVNDKIVSSCEVTTTSASASCPLETQGAGYYVVHAQAKDERGNPVGASYSMYVTGESAQVGWPMHDNSWLDLVADKSSYAIGQNAKILLKSPFAEADALVTVERANTLAKFRVHVKGGAPTISVPITADLRPNAYVTVELIRGRIRAPGAKPAESNRGRVVDLGGPSHRIGTVPLTVESASRKLAIALKPQKTQLAPGDTLECDLEVRDAAGAPVAGDVTFYVVDEGVLMLSGYQTPDPLPRFTAGLPLRVASFETRDQLARLLKLKPVLGEDKGYDGGGGGDGARSDFRTTAVFVDVKTDANGRAHVKTKLPESLTTFRIMAVAAAKDDRFGRADSRVTTSRPLMVRPALPRFVRAGDHIEAGAVLTSKDLPAGPVDVRATVQGAVLEGPGTARVELPKGGSAEVRFRFHAAQVGSFTLTLEASGLGARDTVRVTRAVQIPTVYETVSLSGETEGAVGERIGDLSAVRTDSGTLSVRMASTALVGIESLVADLDAYPHGCTEQLGSRLLPLLEGGELARTFGIAQRGSPAAAARSVLAEIVQRQRPDGGFGYWAHSAQSDAWLSGYTTLILTRAQAAGFSLPPRVLERATQHLFERLADRSTGRGLSWSERALLLDVLAGVGANKSAVPGADPPLSGSLHGMLPVPNDAPLFARALLTHAAAVGQVRAEDRAQLVRELEQHVRLTATGAKVVEERADPALYRRLLDSERRSAAMVLRALLAADPLHPLAPKLARSLVQDAEQATTQEAGWVLLALDDYRKAYEKTPAEFRARLFASGEFVHEADFRANVAVAQTVDLPLAKLIGGRTPLAFEVRGAGTLFYEARLRYARKQNPTVPLARGFSLQKFVRVVDPSSLATQARSLPARSLTEARAGDLLLVDLLLMNDRTQLHVALDDPLPAGLEAVQGELATSASSLQRSLAGADDEDAGERFDWAPYERKNEDDRVLTYIEELPPGLHHYRYLARATTRGSFVVPPTRAECMYEPDVMGRTAGGHFSVH